MDTWLETTDLIKLLAPLLAYPLVAAFIDLDTMQELERLGLWSLETYSITDSGRAFLTKHQ
jgi:hypothetical protein